MNLTTEHLIVAALVVWAAIYLGRELRKNLQHFRPRSSAADRKPGCGGCH